MSLLQILLENIWPQYQSDGSAMLESDIVHIIIIIIIYRFPMLVVNFNTELVVTSCSLGKRERVQPILFRRCIVVTFLMFIILS